MTTIGVFLLLLAASFLLVLVLGGSKDQKEEQVDEEELLEEEEEEELEREYGADRTMTMMLHQISRFYQRMICPQETMITLK